MPNPTYQPYYKTFEEVKRCKRRLNVFLPAGTGDTFWILAKFLNELLRRKAILWIPAAEQRRAGEYLAALGFEWGFCDGLTTNWVWDQDSSTTIPDVGWIVLQANRHLEAGLHLRDWFPNLPLEYPVIKNLPKDKTKEPFVIVFTGERRYMQGNALESEWAEIAKLIHRKIAPVRFLGAGRDVEFVDSIRKYGQWDFDPILGRPITEVIAAASSKYCKGIVGVASGPLILGIASGAPTLIAYPRWLAPMPGTWEPRGSHWIQCFVDQLLQAVRNGAVEDVVNLGRARIQLRG